MTQIMKTALVPVACGSEDIETVTIIDTLRRANIQVTIASVSDDLQVRLAQGTHIRADKMIQDVLNETFDVIALAGGVDGANMFCKNSMLKDLLMKQKQRDGLIGAICASPALVLQPLGLLNGIKATCYPSFQKNLDHVVTNENVVVSHNIVTSLGPATAMSFAIALIELLFNATQAKSVADGMLVPFVSVPRYE